METDVSLLLQRSDVADSLMRLGIKFERRKSKRGNELYFPCPTDNHVSDPSKLRCSMADSGQYKGHFYCWACGFRGNLIHMIRFIHSCGFVDAINFLESKYGPATVEGTAALSAKLRLRKPLLERKEKIIFDLPDDYKPILESNHRMASDALAWLRSERNISDEAIARFEIGVCNHPKIGFAVVMPVYFCGEIRSVFYAQPFKGGLKRYPTGSPQGEILFNYDNCLHSKSYIMVESILDVVKIWSITGIDTMACFTNMISANQLRLLSKFEKHGVMPDLDGYRGWDLVDRMVPTTGKSLEIYLVPVGKDPGDCTPDEIFATMSNALTYADYEFTQIHGADESKAKVTITQVMKK